MKKFPYLVGLKTKKTVHEAPTKMYVLTVVHGSRNDILLRIRPRNEESPMCLAYNNLT